MDILEQMRVNGTSSSGLGSLGRSAARRSTDREEAERLGRTAAAAGGADVDGKLRNVAEEFVTVFMNQIMSSMRANVPTNPEMHGGNGERFFQDMLDTEHSEKLAQGSGYGLTDLVYQALASKSRITESPAPRDGSGEASLSAEPETTGIGL